MASDILQGVGNVLPPRCDTFTVRAYGELEMPMMLSWPLPTARLWW